MNHGATVQRTALVGNHFLFMAPHHDVFPLVLPIEDVERLVRGLATVPKQA